VWPVYKILLIKSALRPEVKLNFIMIIMPENMNCLIVFSDSLPRRIVINLSVG